MVIITGVKLEDVAPDTLHIYGGQGHQHYLSATQEYAFPVPPNGTGDLFSAIFLGTYLRHNSIEQALQRSVGLMDRVLAKTATSGQRELRVLDVDYRQEDVSTLTAVAI